MGALDRVFRSRRPSQERPLAASIAGLWGNGEQGVWYDVESFRDAWNNVGPEQLTNGNFDTGLSGWSSVQPAGSSITAAGGSVAFTSDGASYAAFTQGNVFEIGKIYIVTLEGVSGTGSLKAVGVDTEVIFTTSRTIVGRATASSFSIARVAGVAASMSIGGVSVREWLGATTCSLFQDAVGTLPCYLPGQGQVDPPVGLLLDKRRGLARGPELLTNGDFSAGAANWGVSGTDATHIATFANGVLRYQSDTTSPVLLVSQSSVTTPGRWYEVTVTVSAWVSGGIKTDSFVQTSVPIALGLGTYRVIGLAAGSSFSFSRNSANVDLTIDSISIRELSGNHAYQTTTASRPTLSARYNWAVATEDLTPSVWAKGTPAFTVTPKSTLAPDGVSMADVVVSPDTGTPVLSQQMAAAATSAAVTFFIKPIANAASLALLFRNHTTSTNYNPTLLNTVTGAVGDPAWAAQSAPGGWWKVTYTKVGGMSIGDNVIIYAGATGAPATPGRSWAVWGLDVRGANDGIGLPPYQRVVDASTYDTAGFPLYLKFDGVDDFLQTASVDFSGTDKLFATAALRKLSDASAGVVVELSAVSNTNNGSFALLAPAGPNDTLAVYMRGATALTTSVPSGVPSPASRVFTGVMDTSAAVGRQSRSRLNGAHYAYASQDSGGGNFGSYPLYIGRRGGTSLPFNGRLYALLIRSGAAPDSLILKAERYLNQKARIY